MGIIPSAIVLVATFYSGVEFGSKHPERPWQAAGTMLGNGVRAVIRFTESVSKKTVPPAPAQTA